MLLFIRRRPRCIQPRGVCVLSVTLRTFGSSKDEMAVMGACSEVLPPLGKEETC